MGQFGNRVSCAKEEICLSTEYSPELMSPNTLISSVAAFCIKKNSILDGKYASEGKGTL